TDAIEATIAHNANVAAGRNVNVRAVDATLLNAGAGSAAISGSGGGVGGVSLALTGAFATNTVVDTVQATIVQNADVAAGANGVLESDSATQTVAVAAGGTVAGAGGAIGGVVVSGVGSFATNTIKNTIEALIKDGSHVAAHGNVVLKADQSHAAAGLKPGQLPYSVGAAAGNLTVSASGGAVGGAGGAAPASAHGARAPHDFH